MPSGQFSHFRDEMSLARDTGHRGSIPGRSRPFRDGWQAYRCHTCHPTNNVKHWRKNVIFHKDLLNCSLIWGLPILSLTTKALVTSGKVAMPLISPLTPVPQVIPNTEQWCSPDIFKFSVTWRKSVVWLTASCSAVQASRLTDFTFETWTPRLRWIPAHRMHRNTPRFHDAHRGPEHISHYLGTINNLPPLIT